MPSIDPKTYMSKSKERETDDDAAALGALSIADLVAALKAATGNDEASMKQRAAFEAEAYERLHQRENRNFPRISHFSHPEGDVAHPKPALKCKMYWVGYPLELDNLLPAEVDALNRVQPGVYTFKKTDGSQSEFTVKALTDHTGAISQLEMHFPCRGENRHNLPSMLDLLQQVYGYEGGLTREQYLVAELEKIRASISAAA